jgi:hypothetical protein
MTTYKKIGTTKMEAGQFPLDNNFKNLMLTILAEMCVLVRCGKTFEK